VVHGQGLHRKMARVRAQPQHFNAAGPGRGIRFLQAGIKAFIAGLQAFIAGVDTSLILGN